MVEGEERCPSCKSYLAETGLCEMCGWTPGDRVEEELAQIGGIDPEVQDPVPEPVLDAQDTPEIEDPVPPIVAEESFDDDDTTSTTESVPDDRCPSCKSYLNIDNECEICGWAPEAQTAETIEVAEPMVLPDTPPPEVDLSPEHREKGIAKLMKIYDISEAKAERMYDSLKSEWKDGAPPPAQEETPIEVEGEDGETVAVEPVIDEEPEEIEIGGNILLPPPTSEPEPLVAEEYFDDEDIPEPTPIVEEPILDETIVGETIIGEPIEEKKSLVFPALVILIAATAYIMAIYYTYLEGGDLDATTGSIYIIFSAVLMALGYVLLWKPSTNKV